MLKSYFQRWFADPNGTAVLVRRLLAEQAAGQWRRYALAFGLMGIAAASTALGAYLVGDVINQAMRFRDHKAICERSAILMLDHQSRRHGHGFAQNAEAGKLIHGLMGWDKLIPESIAHYQAGQPTFRVASKPEPEVRMWAFEGFAGGIQPDGRRSGLPCAHQQRHQFRIAFFAARGSGRCGAAGGHSRRGAPARLAD